MGGLSFPEYVVYRGEQVKSKSFISSRIAYVPYQMIAFLLDVMVLNQPPGIIAFLWTQVNRAIEKTKRCMKEKPSVLAINKCIHNFHEEINQIYTIRLGSCP